MNQHDENQQDQETSMEALYGSDIHPAHISIGMQLRQLGDFVAAAHAKSGLSVDDWNAMSVDQRHRWIDEEIVAAGGSSYLKPAPQTPTVRAKFQLLSKQEHLSYGGIQYGFSPVCADEVAENQRFHKYTPSGSLNITVDNPDVKFELGKHYYLDFTPAD